MTCLSGIHRVRVDAATQLDDGADDAARRGSSLGSASVPPEWKGILPATVVMSKIALHFLYDATQPSSARRK
jgi:hypothetical protein